jgi:hypothetical protein
MTGFRVWSYQPTHPFDLSTYPSAPAVGRPTNPPVLRDLPTAAARGLPKQLFPVGYGQLIEHV